MCSISSVLTFTVLKYSITLMIDQLLSHKTKKHYLQSKKIRSHKIVRNNGILHVRYLWSIDSIALYTKHHIKSRLLSLSSIFKILVTWTPVLEHRIALWCHLKSA